MDPAQTVPTSNPDSLHDLPEVTGLKANLDAITTPKDDERAGEAVEKAASVQAAQSAASAAHQAMVPVVPPPLTDTQQAATDDASHTDSPTVADDNDLIEQEWVLKAKAIVESTKDDPYSQNKEMNKFKADYLKKRYKRDIKVSEA